MPASPILLLVPYRNKAAVLYSQIPTSASASGDMVVSRAGVSTRVNAQGLIQSVAANVPRLNYPLGGVANGCPALLVEPSGTNLIFRSEEFATSPWAVLNGATVNVNTEISPDGTQNADRINLASGNVNSIVRQINRTIANSTTYTLSCFYKNNTIASGEEFRLVFNNNASAPNNFEAIAFININAGTATYSIAGTLGTGYSGTATGRVENYGNGWYRFSLTFTVGTAGAATNADVYIGQANTANGRSYYAWGAQLEVGSVATSYIPTTTGTVTRNADIVTNNTFVIPNLIGAILTEFDSPTSGTYFLDNIPIPIASGSNKIAISYTPTTLTIYRNGAQVSGSPVTPPGGTAPVIGNVINIGHNNQLYQLGSGIKSFVLYSSTLSAAEASGLTT